MIPDSLVLRSLPINVELVELLKTEPFSGKAPSQIELSSINDLSKDSGDKIKFFESSPI